MFVTIRVTKNDIAKGHRLCGTSCPVYHAASRVFGTKIYVSHDDLWVRGKVGRLLKPLLN